MLEVVVLNWPEVNRGIEAALKDYQRQVVEATSEAIDVTSEEIIDEAKSQTPVDTGELVGSAHRDTPPAVTGTKAEAEVGFNAPYAGYVHENMKARHDKGGPKFLERAVMSVGPSLRENVLKELK